MLMHHLNSQYLKQITDSASFFYADHNLMAFVLILFTAFFLGFSFLIVFLNHAGYCKSDRLLEYESEAATIGMSAKMKI